jgi:hypothetical protein
MKPIHLAAIFVVSATMCQADQYTETMTRYAHENVLTWVQDPALINAIRTQNLRTGSLEQAQIDEMDRLWRGEVGMADRPTVDPVLKHPASDYLRGRVAASEGIITEAFVMDQRGLNVAASDATSDYWQGDEAKFTETYGKGPSSIHISDIEFDESTQTYQGQLSVAITDPDTGAVIGAITVGLNAEMLF